MATGMQRIPGPRYKHVADDAAPYETITIDKLTPIIGAEIGGVDLSKPLSNRTADEIHRALAENLVIFFRDQHLTPEQHLAFGRMFGDLHIHPAAPHAPGHPELMIIHADKDSPRANGEGWHSDVSCDEEPPMGSILYIKTCPPKGGDTLFANMYAAYEALSDRMKQYLEGLTAVHDGEANYRGTYANFGVKDKPTYPRAEHPVIRVHPVTKRKALFVNQRLHPLHRRHPARRKRRRPALSVRAHGQPAVPVPFPLARELDRVLGQPLRAASRHVGLLAAHPLGFPGDRAGRPAGLSGRRSGTSTHRPIAAEADQRPGAQFDADLLDDLVAGEHPRQHALDLPGRARASASRRGSRRSAARYARPPRPRAARSGGCRRTRRARA